MTERCIHCGAGNSAHHSYTCPTGLHPDAKPNNAYGSQPITSAVQPLQQRIKELEAELALERKLLHVVAEWYCEVYNVTARLSEEETSVDAIISEAIAKAKEAD